MKKKEPLWKSRTLMSFLAIAIVWALWERFANILGHLNDAQGPSLVAITQTVLWIVGLIVASLSGIKSIEKIFEFRNEGISSVAQSVITETQKMVRPKDHDDIP